MRWKLSVENVEDETATESYKRANSRNHMISCVYQSSTTLRFAAVAPLRRKQNVTPDPTVLKIVRARVVQIQFMCCLHRGMIVCWALNDMFKQDWP